MIRCLVSGEVATVAMVDDLDVSYIKATEPNCLIKSTAAGIKQIFSGANDVEEIAVKNINETFPRLLTKYNFDRGLMLLDIAISDDDEELRLDAALCFEEIMRDDEAFSKIKNYVFSSENPLLPNDEWLLFIKSKAPNFAKFVADIQAFQPHILRIQAALDESLAYSDLSQSEAEQFRCFAIETGSFADLVLSGNDESRVNVVILDCFNKLKNLRSARAITAQWTKGMSSKRTRQEIKRIDGEIERFQDEDFIPRSNTEKSSYDTYFAVRKQIGAIVERLKSHDVNSARKYSKDLVRSQIRNGDHVFAAKSLSNLAVEARKLGQLSLELEWARDSVELAPEDGVAHGVLADTFLRLSRIPEAKNAFERAASLGEEQFGEVGVGRVLRYCGHYDEAYEIFQSVIKKLTFNSLSPETIASYAALLNDMWRQDESLEAYEQGLNVHPADTILSCGKASVLADLGKLTEAAGIYKSIISKSNDSPVAWCGLADVYKEQGLWDESLEVYKEAVDKFPSSIVAHCGYADVLRASGDFDTAFDYYKKIEKTFPFSSAPLSGRSETLKDMRRYKEALELLVVACEEYPLDQRLRNGLANAYKLCGDFPESLRQFDLNVRDFPYNLYDLGGRANLLRLLGKYDQAISAYDDILVKRPDYRFANNAKAAILSAQQKYDEALEILDPVVPATEVQWSTMHIRAVTLMKIGDLDEAEALLKKGLAVPFIRMRFMFERALALLNIKRSRLHEARQNLEGHNDSTSQLISIHILVKLGNMLDAGVRFKAVNDNLPGALSAVHERLSRVVLLSKFDDEADDYIFQKEVEALLQAA